MPDLIIEIEYKRGIKVIDLRKSVKLYTLKDIVIENEVVNLINAGHFGCVKARKFITQTIYNNIDFEIELDRLAPFLKGFSLEDNGFILAGGSVINILMGINHINDFDIFPVFHNSKSIEQSITNLVFHLENYLKIQYFSEQPCLKIIKTKYALTIISEKSNFKIQIICGIDIDFILKPKIESMLDILYNVCKLDETFDLELNIDIKIEGSKKLFAKPLDYNNSKLNYVKLKKRKELGLEMCKHILDGFDIGASQVAWDGNSILMTELGKFAIEYKSIIFDNKTYSKNTNFRITKYYNRGFNLFLPNTNSKLFSVLPFLNIDNMRGYISLKFNANQHNKIKISNYENYEYNLCVYNCINIDNFINFCLNDSNLNDKNLNNKDLNNKDLSQLYYIIIENIKKELKEKKYNKIIKIFNKHISLKLISEKFNENLIKNILINKLNKFMETINFSLIHQASNFNELFDKKGIELAKWYGKAFIP